jgi:hypothetical protein
VGVVHEPPPRTAQPLRLHAIALIISRADVDKFE